ncbi:anti-repressor SinI family protein [Ornithinibacillus salinisoli]|uniref:Anti-repressor SinI family protein n=1 Tax=Ornithinibacillus salinisoli TaxID=1848459 RepID=A0ABW4VZ35_9BACI
MVEKLESKLTIQTYENVDYEWLSLILEAKKHGISLNEIRNFLKDHSSNR